MAQDIARLDETLEKDVHPDQLVLRGPIWEPYELYKRFTGQGKKKRVYSGFLSEEDLVLKVVQGTIAYR